MTRVMDPQVDHIWVSSQNKSYTVSSMPRVEIKRLISRLIVYKIAMNPKKRSEWLEIFNSELSRRNNPSSKLNYVEIEILQQVANGLKTHEIGNKLKMPPATVETYRVRICRLLKVPNSCAAVAHGFRNKLIK